MDFKSTKLFIFLTLTTISFAQNDVSVEKSLFGVQTGLFGVWVHNELKLSNEIALRSEAGINFGLIGGEVQGSTKFITAPNISLEPRWYYNLEKRVNKGKNIKNNSSNFVTLAFNFFPKKEGSNYYVPSQLFIIPKWGIKRSINHFTYETGIGLGKIIYLEKVPDSFNKAVIDLHLRIGYTF